MDRPYHQKGCTCRRNFRTIARGGCAWGSADGGGGCKKTFSNRWRSRCRPREPPWKHHWRNNRRFNSRIIRIKTRRLQLRVLALQHNPSLGVTPTTHYAHLAPMTTGPALSEQPKLRLRIETAGFCARDAHCRPGRGISLCRTNIQSCSVGENAEKYSNTFNKAMSLPAKAYRVVKSALRQRSGRA